MKYYWYIIIALGVIALSMLVRYIVTKNKSSSSTTYSGDSSLLDRAKSRIKNLGDCCKRIFGGA